MGCSAAGRTQLRRPGQCRRLRGRRGRAGGSCGSVSAADRGGAGARAGARGDGRRPHLDLGTRALLAIHP